MDSRLLSLVVREGLRERGEDMEAGVACSIIV